MKIFIKNWKSIRVNKPKPNADKSIVNKSKFKPALLEVILFWAVVLLRVENLFRLLKIANLC